MCSIAIKMTEITSHYKKIMSQSYSNFCIFTKEVESDRKTAFTAGDTLLREHTQL